jgi:hypothetical protein
VYQKALFDAGIGATAFTAKNIAAAAPGVGTNYRRPPDSLTDL